jgi:hypothetical protein
LPRFGRLARASAPLLMQTQDKIFVGESREMLSFARSRPVRVTNAVLKIRAQKIASNGSFRTGRSSVIVSTLQLAKRTALRFCKVAIVPSVDGFRRPAISSLLVLATLVPTPNALASYPRHSLIEP